MKTVNEVLGKIKGEDKINQICTGKGSFSKSTFADMTSAMANDSTFKIPTYDKEGKKNGEVSISELVRSDLKKTLEKAKYPQKSEAGVLDTCEIYTAGIAEAIPHIAMQWMACGKKLDLPQQPNCVGSVYLADVPGKVKEIRVRDPKTQQDMGTCTVVSKDSIQVRTKSPVPSNLQTKTRKDPSGKVMK